MRGTVVSDTQARLNDIGMESEYWRLALDDVIALAGLVDRAAGELGEVCVAQLSVITAPPELRLSFVSDGITAAGTTMQTLQEMMPKLAAITELVEGRHTVLTAAVAELARVGG